MANSGNTLLLIYAPVGRVKAAADGKVQVELPDQWLQVARDLNAAIEGGVGLMGDDGTVRQIPAVPLSPEQLKTLSDVIENRSRGQLLVFPADQDDET